MTNNFFAFTWKDVSFEVNKIIKNAVVYHCFWEKKSQKKFAMDCIIYHCLHSFWDHWKHLIYFSSITFTPCIWKTINCFWIFENFFKYALKNFCCYGTSCIRPQIMSAPHHCINCLSLDVGFFKSIIFSHKIILHHKEHCLFWSIHQFSVTMKSYADYCIEFFFTLQCLLEF